MITARTELIFVIGLLTHLALQAVPGDLVTVSIEGVVKFTGVYWDHRYEPAITGLAPAIDRISGEAIAAIIHRQGVGFGMI